MTRRTLLSLLFVAPLLKAREIEHYQGWSTSRMIIDIYPNPEAAAFLTGLPTPEEIRGVPVFCPTEDEWRQIVAGPDQDA